MQVLYDIRDTSACTGSDSTSPFSVPALIKASQVGELSALEEAYEGSWFLSKGFQWLLDVVHGSTASPWCVPDSPGVLVLLMQCPAHHLGCTFPAWRLFLGLNMFQ